jgi:polysaccharide export outer membrane protein
MRNGRDCRTVVKRSREVQRWVAIAFVTLCALCTPTVAPAQDHSAPNSMVPNSDLARENLSHVAASAAQIRAALANDAGLLVDLKRWMARDAASHGQIVRDEDLADDAIFERLETDIQFRAIATSLLQQYGYLVPTVNPNSELGKERELLVQERTKWLAQNQEEELAQARQTYSQNLQNATFCGPQLPENCKSPSAGSPTSGARGRGSSPGLPPSEVAPAGPIVPGAPGTGGNATGPTQIAQANQDASDVFFPLSIGDSITAGVSPRGVSLSSTQGATAQLANPEASSALPMGGFVGSEPGIDGQLREYAAGGNAAGSISSDTSMAIGRGFGPDATPTAPANALMAEPDRRYQPTSVAQPAELVRKSSPYSDIPSLYDMYVQATPQPGNPRRFGTEVFENGARDSQVIPMDLPAGPDYVVGPGDGLSIDLWGGVSQRLYRTVDREGRVSLPEVGPVLVSGKSLSDVQLNLQQVLKTQFRDVSADVSLSRLRTIRVYEVGDITNPGAYDISSLSTPLNALFAASGPTPSGSMRILKHYRGNQLIQTVDVYDLLLHGIKANLQRLENGDTILVPPTGPQVTVEGMVRRPAVYELLDEKTLADILNLAGGLLPIAALRHIEVERTVAHDKRTMLNLDIPETGDDAEVTKKLGSFEIHDGDRVRIFPIAPYNQNAVYVEGHVIRPGKYSYRENMRVTDIISSYGDLLPEPSAQYAEIIHLNAPDFRPSVESFNLADAIAKPLQAPVLRPLDTVRIFSRFDFEDPPTVSVLGDVRLPGLYKTSGQIRISDAVHLAGGLSPDAERGDAQVFRYLPDGKSKIFSVSLNQALEGDPTENIALQPRDRLLIHKSPDAVEPATVYIEGEVANPGRYPLTTNMRIEDLVRVGGGLKPSADMQSADLTKYQWSDQTKLTGQQQTIAISTALSGDTNADVPLHNGDVLTIRQLPGWNDLGASIVVKGEAKHPGTYGIRPGEKLSSVLERAGGFAPDAYPAGAILQRNQVRELQLKDQDQMILRIKDAQNGLELLPDTTPQAKQAKEVALQQWQSALEEVSANPPVGRVVIRISSEIDRWKNTGADIEVRAGDVLTIPKRPSYVVVTGQVFHATAVSYRPGKNAKWYLSQAGGPTQIANKKAIFVIRANGAVLNANTSLWSGDAFGAPLQPGDTVVVPEKALGGGLQWQSVLLTAQAASAIATAVFIAVRY